MPDPAADAVVLDASALVEALLGSAVGLNVRQRMRGAVLHAPAHLDAEVLSALGRLHRAGDLPPEAVSDRLRELISAPITRHALPDLLADAWQARDRFRLVDALYVALCEQLETTLVTTDARLARESELAELITSAP